MTGKLEKVGRLMVKNGTYEKDGETKNRYHEIGVVFATPHHSNMCVKLHANGFGEGMFANIFYDEDKKPNFATTTPLGGDEAEIRPEEIPF